MAESNAAQSAELCRLCGVKASMKCPRCCDVSYCCDEHITEDLPQHKRLCAAPTGVRPRTVKISAILFPVNEDAPRIVKVLCKVQREDPTYPGDLGIAHSPNLRKWFEIRSVRPTIVLPMVFSGGPPVDGSAPAYDLVVSYDACYLFNGSRINRCLRELTGGWVWSCRPWAGNIVVMRKETPPAGCRSLRFHDADMEEDLPKLMHFFATPCTHPSHSTSTSPAGTGYVKSFMVLLVVLVACVVLRYVR